MSAACAPRRLRIIRPEAFSLAALNGSLRELFDYADLIHTLTLHRLKVRYKQSQLGIAWALLQPLSLMFIYTLVFSVFMRMPASGVPYSVFVYTGLLAWTFFSSSISTSAAALVSQPQLITKVYFPREILPITYVLAALTDFLIGSTLLAGFLAWHRISLGINVLFAVPVLVTGVILATAVALLTSALQVRLRDVGVAIPLLLQLWSFATPVVYPLTLVPERFRLLYMMNPMVGIVENFRRAVLLNQPPEQLSLGIAVVWAALLLPVSYLVFKRFEATMADVI